LVFANLARRTLAPLGALFATAAYALNPLLIYLGSAMQPEPLMLFLCLVAVDLMWRWDATSKFSTLLAAAALTGFAVSAKLPAAYLGLMLAYIAVRKLGGRVLTDLRLYVAAAVAVLPPLAWYAWAAHFWITYGNSLGVSNESHYLGVDMLFPPKFLFGIL